MLTNLDVSQIIVETLVQSGVTQFVISPGSRSTPLTVAIARHPATNSVVHLDERGAAFYALGYARATGTPAGLVCTSGTAVANYFPAVVEASMDNVPLIILSADRPPELIDVGANQAIFQQNIYGVYPRLSLNLPPPETNTSASDIHKQVVELFLSGTTVRPGPVHLNCQFREPLLPQGDVELHVQAGLTNWAKRDVEVDSTFTPSLPELSGKIQMVLKNFQASKRGLIIVGRSVKASCNQSILQLAESLHLPLLPDVQSRMRFGEHPLIINHFDLALLSDELQAQKPDFVLHFGGAFTSKRLLNYLADSEMYYISVKDTPERIDPNHQVSLKIQTDIETFCKSLETQGEMQDDQWLKSWQAAERGTVKTIMQLVGNSPELTEPGISYQLSRLIPAGHALLLANSMSIREMEMFASTGHLLGEVFSNRGSSGIDGLLATAAGYAAGSNEPVTILIGDLAFLHDLNSLHLIKISKQPIIMVVVNNDGGGIFSFLPVRSETDVFEPYFGTPHGLKLEHAASLFGLTYANPKDIIEFESTYTLAAKEGKSVLIELFTDRIENHHFHQSIFQSLRESS
jgi:2-succinyl-5-enolpyruvyl-6-hydroxy-3-cyclohexene-1-carboxylate synthase